MKLVVIPPYRTEDLLWHKVDSELLARLERRGQLTGVEVDMDEGALIESPTGEGRDEEFLATINLGTIRRVKHYAQLGQHDAIVILGVLSPGFTAARALTRVPVAGPLHSSLHMASLIGKRFGLVHAAASSSSILRSRAEEYGFGSRLASVRYIGRSSTFLYNLVTENDEAARAQSADVRQVVQETVDQCIAAIERERVDVLLLNVEPLQIFEEEVRSALDDAGYQEVPIITELSAAIEMAKAMVSSRLTQAVRAYPHPAVKAPPEFW